MGRKARGSTVFRSSHNQLHIQKQLEVHHEEQTKNHQEYMEMKEKNRRKPIMVCLYLVSMHCLHKVKSFIPSPNGASSVLSRYSIECTHSTESFCSLDWHPSSNRTLDYHHCRSWWHFGWCTGENQNEGGNFSGSAGIDAKRNQTERWRQRGRTWDHWIGHIVFDTAKLGRIDIHTNWICSPNKQNLVSFYHWERLNKWVLFCPQWESHCAYIRCLNTCILARPHFSPSLFIGNGMATQLLAGHLDSFGRSTPR